MFTERFLAETVQKQGFPHLRVCTFKHHKETSMFFMCFAFFFHWLSFVFHRSASASGDLGGGSGKVAAAFANSKRKTEMGAFILRSAQGAPATRPANYDVDTTQLRFRLL